MTMFSTMRSQGKLLGTLFPRESGGGSSATNRGATIVFPARAGVDRFVILTL